MISLAGCLSPENETSTAFVFLWLQVTVTGEGDDAQSRIIERQVKVVVEGQVNRSQDFDAGTWRFDVYAENKCVYQKSDILFSFYQGWNMEHVHSWSVFLFLFYYGDDRYGSGTTSL